MKLFANKTNSLSVVPFKKRAFTRLPRLTAYDVMRVNHATIREGESHNIWPPHIFEQFLAADVIRGSNTAHYRITDANLRRI
jgi:hypothetical protein